MGLGSLEESLHLDRDFISFPQCMHILQAKNVNSSKGPVLKSMSLICNPCCMLGGCGILGVGIWLAVTQGNFATLSSSFPSLSAANLLIITGTFVMIIGFVGCIGAIKENKCLLLTFFIMLLLVFVLELTVVILFFVYTDKLPRNPRSHTLATQLLFQYGEL
ncbi:Tetraspanin-9 [Varanus komodoensis]|nr:Tetraspanin-9 [Varanus komodoensis]